jgi:hypothetical protein
MILEGFVNCIGIARTMVAGWIMALWAKTREPHRVALEMTGIRIVAPAHYGAVDDVEDHDRVYAALMALNHVAPEALWRVRKQIGIIFLSPISGPPCNLGRVCLMNLESLGPQEPERAITIAGVLVYLATYAGLKSRVGLCGFRRSARMRRLSRRAQELVIKKLSSRLCEP